MTTEVTGATATKAVITNQGDKPMTVRIVVRNAGKVALTKSLLVQPGDELRTVFTTTE